MSKDTLSDILRKDGYAVMDDAKKDKEKKVQNEVRKLNVIYLSVFHFDRKMKKMVENLKVRLDKLPKGTYSQKTYAWRDRYDEITREKGSKSNR